MAWLSADYSGKRFALFSSEHWLALLAVLAVILIVVVVFRRRTSLRVQRIVRYGLASLLLATELAWQGWQVAVGLWHVSYSLPLHLCTISLLLSAVMLVRRDYALFELIYFWAFAGTVHALITPDLGMYNFPHFRFFHYFSGHGTVILAVVYMVVAEGYRPTWRSIWKVFWVTNAYAAVMVILNLVTNGNYLVLSGKPTVPTLVDHLGPWPWYILSLEAVGLVSCLIYYLPFAIIDWRAASRSNRPADGVGGTSSLVP